MTPARYCQKCGAETILAQSARFRGRAEGMIGPQEEDGTVDYDEEYPDVTAYDDFDAGAVR